MVVISSLILVSIVIVFVSYMLSVMQLQNVVWIEYIYEVLDKFDSMIVVMVDQEIGMCVYFLVGDLKFLELQIVGVKVFQVSWIVVKSLILDNLVQQVCLVDVVKLVEIWINMVVKFEMEFMKDLVNWEKV